MGQVSTRQNRRDFTADEVRRAMTRLGFTCHDRPAAAAVSLGVCGATPLRATSTLLGGTGSVEVCGTGSVEV